MRSTVESSSSPIAHNEWWDSAIDNLRTLHAEYGDAAQRAADAYAAVYAGRRAAMVYDIVASRQRKYETRVLTMVRDFEEHEQSLESLAADGPAYTYGLTAAEPQTMQDVAQGLVAYGERQGCASEDETAEQWARSVQTLEHAHALDPYVGSVKGIGPALFAYARMRSGADAIKPDLRVVRALRNLGFEVANNPHAVITLATASSRELGIDRLTLDQLLWRVTT